MLRGFTYGPEVDWWALGIVMYGMMVGRVPFNIPIELRYLANTFKFRAKYPRNLTGYAVYILEGVRIFNTKTEAFRSALEFLEFGVFPHLVALYSHRVNIKMCFWIEGRLSVLNFVCFILDLCFETCYHISTCLNIILTLKFQNLLGPFSNTIFTIVVT
jgi:serine/threonine protein kinase